MIYEIVYGKKFRKQFRRLTKSGFFNRERAAEAFKILADGEKLDDIYRDHALTGDMAEYREFHLSGDLIVVYKVNQMTKVLIFWRIGNHANVFE